MAAEPIAVIDFPLEWIGGHGWLPGHPSVILHNDAETMFAAGGVLDDGTNLLGLTWSGGQRLARVSPDTGWAIEERFAGDAPREAQQVWRVIVQSLVEAAAQVWDELGGRA